MPDRTCSMDDCVRPVQARGWCWKHYQRWRRRGTPELETPGERLARFIALNDQAGCWRWDGSIDPNGYGRITVDGSTRYAHRIVYENHVGPIPQGLELDHLCRVRSCVNPAHLEPVTHQVNVDRGMGHGSETHCPSGHPYAGENLSTWTDSNGITRRQCRTCKRAAGRRWRARQRQSA